MSDLGLPRDRARTARKKNGFCTGSWGPLFGCKIEPLAAQGVTSRKRGGPVAPTDHSADKPAAPPADADPEVSAHGDDTVVPRLSTLDSPPAAPDKAALRYDGKAFGEWRLEWLRGNREALKALEAFAAAGYEKEVSEAMLFGLYSNSPFAAQQARRHLRDLPPTEMVTLVPKLVTTLRTELGAKRRIAVIRALAAIGPPAEDAMEVLKERLDSHDPQERIATTAAIQEISGEQSPTPREEAADVEAFRNAVMREKQLLPPVAKESQSQSRTD